MTQYKHKFKMFVGLIAITLTGLSCGGNIEKRETPVYNLDSDVLYNGSIYFNQAGCAACHGVDLKGNGPDAAGKSIPDLTTKLKPEKTHLDYFKSISANSVHSGYLSWTDRGRWAMAHYLYSRSGGIIKGKDSTNKRSLAITLANKEIESAYENQRRWFMGAKPLGERPGPKSKRLDIDSLIKNESLDSELSINTVSSSRKGTILSTRGETLYKNNCSSCHGLYAEGTTSTIALGPIGPCKGRGRQCVSYLSAASLKNRIGNTPHREGGLNIPTFGSLTDNDWQEINDYLASLPE